MRYAEYQPAPGIARFVDRYWILEGCGAGQPEPILPDGRIEIVLHYGEPFERHHPDGRIEQQDAALVVGQMRAPICIAPRGVAGVAGIRLKPAAGRCAIGCRADEISGHVVDLGTLCAPMGSLRERLAEARTDRVRIVLLDDWVRRAVRAEPLRAVEAAVASIDARCGATDLKRIAREAGVGLRQLERQFNADVGLSPKTYARLVRLQAALRAVGTGRALADVALACGYYDQAHMANDFAHLAQTSPAAWRRHAGELTPLFVSAAV
jgi:AraC-like DNA-binding protein